MIDPFTHGDETHRREQEQWMFHAQVSDLEGQGWPWGSVRFVFDVCMYCTYIYIYDIYIYTYVYRKKSNIVL